MRGRTRCICRCQQRKTPRAFSRKQNFIPLAHLFIAARAVGWLGSCKRWPNGFLVTACHLLFTLSFWQGAGERDGTPAGTSASGFPLPTLPSASVPAWPLTTGASWLGQLLHSQALSHGRDYFIPKARLMEECCGSSILRGLPGNIHQMDVSRALLGMREMATKCSQTKKTQKKTPPKPRC